jgi:hypothetical protein
MKNDILNNLNLLVKNEKCYKSFQTVLNLKSMFCVVAKESHQKKSLAQRFAERQEEERRRIEAKEKAIREERAMREKVLLHFLSIIP